LPYRARGRGTSGGGIPVRICPDLLWLAPGLRTHAPTSSRAHRQRAVLPSPNPSRAHQRSHTVTPPPSRYPRTPPLPPPAPLAQLAKSKWQMLDQLAVLHRRPPGAPRTQTNKGNDPLHFRRRPAPIQHNSYKPFLLGKPDFYSKNRRP